MKRKIKQLVNELYDKYNTEDPFELADYLDILVYKYHFKNINGLVTNIKGQAVIGINSNLEITYQKAVLLHEIGHKLLHSSNYFYIIEKTLVPIGKFEYQANLFQAEYLFEKSKPYPGETIENFLKRKGLPLKLRQYIS